MKAALVGYTGFVGSNLYESGDFDAVYNSKNIQNAYDTKPDLLVYAGLRAEKFLANSNPEKDWVNILNAMDNIKKINPKRLFLISTVDVYPCPLNVDEETAIDTASLLPYGKHRLMLERWVEENFDKFLIVRLPALFGINIKKNFIYDYVNFIPALLNERKYRELSNLSIIVKNSYRLEDIGYYRYCSGIYERNKVINEFRRLNFSALNFTDSNSVFQFYNLNHLWRDIQIANYNKISKINLATEPVSVAELYKYLSNCEFTNNISDKPFRYDFRTKYADVFNRNDGYVSGKQDVMLDIKNFVEMMKNEISN